VISVDRVTTLGVLRLSVLTRSATSLRMSTISQRRFTISRLASTNRASFIALDEFSYLVEDDEAIPSVFQTIVDDVLTDTEISLVLLGSSISMMEEGY